MLTCNATSQEMLQESAIAKICSTFSFWLKYGYGQEEKGFWLYLKVLIYHWKNVSWETIETWATREIWSLWHCLLSTPQYGMPALWIYVRCLIRETSLGTLSQNIIHSVQFKLKSIEPTAIKFDNNKWPRVRHGNYRILLRIKCCKVSRIFHL